MSEKKYPTRMHEVLGVQTKEMFALNVGLDNPNYYLTDDGDMFMRYGTANKTIRMAHADEVLDAINHGITRHPRLTEEAQEKEQYGQQMIWKMCDDLGDEIGYLDDVIAMLEKLEVEG